MNNFLLKVLLRYLSFSEKTRIKNRTNPDIVGTNGSYNVGLYKTKDGKIKYYFDVDGELNEIAVNNKDAVRKFRDDLSRIIEEE